MIFHLPCLYCSCTIPFESISKVTSIYGTPLGAGGILLNQIIPIIYYPLLSPFLLERPLLKPKFNYQQQWNKSSFFFLG